MNNDPIDIHTKTAMELFKLSDPSEVTPAQRNYAKQWNYLECYQANVPINEKIRPVLVLANVSKVDLAKAEVLLTAFYRRYPELALWQFPILSNDGTVAFKECPRQYGKTFAQSLHDDMCKRMAQPDYKPAKRDKVRTSSKSGATWPKPKDSY